MYKLSSRAFDDFTPWMFLLNLSVHGNRITSQAFTIRSNILVFMLQLNLLFSSRPIKLSKPLILWCKHMFRSWRVFPESWRNKTINISPLLYDIYRFLSYLLENSYLTVGSQVFRQCRVQAWHYNLHLSCVLELHFNGSGILIATRNRQETATPRDAWWSATLWSIWWCSGVSKIARGASWDPHSEGPCVCVCVNC